jgi:hypothetical protein
VVNALIEAAGIVCLVVFAYLLFPPAALCVAGVFLILLANVRASRSASKREDGP